MTITVITIITIITIIIPITITHMKVPALRHGFGAPLYGGMYVCVCVCVFIVVFRHILFPHGSMLCYIYLHTLLCHACANGSAVQCCTLTRAVPYHLICSHNYNDCVHVLTMSVFMYLI
jgi:hypothetical protein